MFTIKTHIKLIIYLGTLVVLFGLSFLIPQYTDLGFYVTQLLGFMIFASSFVIMIFIIYHKMLDRYKEEIVSATLFMTRFFTVIALFGGLFLISYAQLAFIDVMLTPPLANITYYDQYGYYIHQTPYDHVRPSTITIITQTDDTLYMSFSYDNPESELDEPWHTIVRVTMHYDDNQLLTSYISETAVNYEDTKYTSVKFETSFTYAQGLVTKSTKFSLVDLDNQTFTDYDEVNYYPFSDHDIYREEIVRTSYTSNDTGIIFSMTEQAMSADVTTDENNRMTGTITHETFSAYDLLTTQHYFYEFTYTDGHRKISSDGISTIEDNNLWMVVKFNPNSIGDDYDIIERGDHLYINGANTYIKEKAYGYEIERYYVTDGFSNDTLQSNANEINGDYGYYQSDQGLINYLIDFPDFRAMAPNVFISPNRLILLRISSPIITFNPTIKYLITLNE